VLSRSGAFYRLGDEMVGQGRDRAIAELKARPELCARLAALLSDDTSAAASGEVDEAA
jgi:hypothetical protein